MPTKRLKQIFSELSFDKKLIGAGSLLMIIAVFLPWYQDLDSFKTGDMFLGITGPMYLGGLTLMILAMMSLSLLSMDYMGKKISWMPVKNSIFYILTGIFAFYMLIFINSVYFHSKFGINITLKQSQFGMFAGFIAASLITVGGYLSMKDRGEILKEFREKTREPMIKVEAQEPRKPESRLKNIKPSEKNIPTAVTPEAVEQMQMENLAAEPVVRPMAMAEQNAAVNGNPDGNEMQQPEAVQPYRMDL